MPPHIVTNSVELVKFIVPICSGFPRPFPPYVFQRGALEQGGELDASAGDEKNTEKSPEVEPTSSRLAKGLKRPYSLRIVTASNQASPSAVPTVPPINALKRM